MPLDELEFHVREEIERQVKSGLNTPQAFAAAVQQIGQANALKQEFEKAERTFMKRTLIILAGILGVLLGMALIMPAAHLYKEQGMMHNAVVGFSWGIPIVLFGVGTAVFGLKRRKA
ncbi:MAG TPA: hypothetical protein VMA35_02290 [Candidatus Sulfopaludibacter sp.]|nr:hypothetical protein [Candidatus Sulfopaludibacter sp.]